MSEKSIENPPTPTERDRAGEIDDPGSGIRDPGSVMGHTAKNNHIFGLYTVVIKFGARLEQAYFIL